MTMLLDPGIDAEIVFDKGKYFVIGITSSSENTLLPVANIIKNKITKYIIKTKIMKEM